MANQKLPRSIFVYRADDDPSILLATHDITNLVDGDLVGTYELVQTSRATVAHGLTPIARPKANRGNPKWKPGMKSPNPKGRPRG